MTDDAPAPEAGESHLDYAERLVARGGEGERIEFTLSVSAGTAVELAARGPAGASIQSLFRLAAGEFIVANPKRDDTVAGSLDEIIAQLVEIRHAISDQEDQTIAELLEDLRDLPTGE